MQLIHDDKKFYNDCCSENVDVSQCERFYERRTQTENKEVYSPPVCCGESTLS